MRYEDDDSWLAEAAREAHQVIARLHAEGRAALDEMSGAAAPPPSPPRDGTQTGWFEPIRGDFRPEP